jgi:hypothetical protein
MLRRVSIYLRQNVLAVLALFVAVGTGGAYAANTIGSADIIDGQVKSVDVGNGEIKSADVQDQSLTTFDVSTFLGADVVDNSLTGADVDEATLGTVPSSVLGGLGRPGLRQNGQTGPGSCDPETTTFLNCDIAATINLSRPARVFVIGTVRALSVPAAISAFGNCQLGTTSGPIPGTTSKASTAGTSGGFQDTQHMTMAGLTGVLPAGQHAVGVDCNQTADDISYDQAQVTAVALSDQ